MAISAPVVGFPPHADHQQDDGEGLQRDTGLAAHVLAAVGDVPLHLVSQAASRRNITFVIRETDVATALSRLHEAFFAPGQGLRAVAGAVR